MIGRKFRFLSFALISVAWLSWCHQVFSAELPKSTRDILAKTKLNPSVLADVERELEVPKDWTERAKKEGRVRILATFSPTESKAMYAPFRERYPFIAVEAAEASTREQRAVRTLVAYKTGKILTDVLMEIGGSLPQFKEANALEDLRNIPAVMNLPQNNKASDGSWAGMYSVHLCIAYNTKIVKRAELPKKWEDLVTNMRWRGGNLALGNRPNLGFLHLWKAKGESWVKEFLVKLFNDVKPQLRKEGTGTLLELLTPGEFHAVMPALSHRTYEKSKEGAPVGFACPEIVPLDVQNVVIMRGAPNIHSAKIFTNWLLSKEGQIAQFAAVHLAPVHKDLAKPEFMVFPDQILGKEVISVEPEFAQEVLPKLNDFWNNLWASSFRSKN